MVPISFASQLRPTPGSAPYVDETLSTALGGDLVALAVLSLSRLSICPDALSMPGLLAMGKTWVCFCLYRFSCNTTRTSRSVHAHSMQHTQAHAPWASMVLARDHHTKGTRRGSRPRSAHVSPLVTRVAQPTHATQLLSTPITNTHETTQRGGVTI